MITAILNYDFMRNALWAALLASILCGIIGTIIVEKRLVGMSGGLAHASFGGIGAGYFLGIEPIIGGMLFTGAASLLVGQLQRKTRAKADTVVSMFWSAGMALGILFIALTPGYPPDMTSYLFGDILTVSDTYLKLMVLVTLLIAVLVVVFFNYFKLYLFDEEYAKIIGIPVVLIEVILYLMIAFCIVTLIKVVGIILALALLTVPPTTAKLLTKSLGVMMALSIFLGTIYSILGLAVSYYFNIPSGASIILTALLLYGLLVILSRFWKQNEPIKELS